MTNQSEVDGMLNKTRAVLMEILHDMQDTAELIQGSDKALILELINGVKQRTDIGQRIREEFEKNAEVFRRQFNV